MPDSQLNVSLNELREEILFWLQSRLEKESREWLIKKSNNLLSGGEDWEFFTSYSAVPRYTGKDRLNLTEEEQQRADKIRTGWKPDSWTADQLGRTLIVLSIAGREKNDFLELLEKTHQSSDMGEAEALYKSLPVLPYPGEMKTRAAEGIRSNMTSVFNAVALRNPYPADYFDEGPWNQMVLKALFVGSPLYLIQGIDKRANRKLAEMLVDYAHERWAAERSVSPELWRPVGPYADENMLEDLKKVLSHENRIHKQAAFLALSASPSNKAQEIVNKNQGLKDQADGENISWEDIGRRYNNE